MATRTKKPAPRDGAAYRQSIRRVALDVFSTYGFDGTSTRQIATAAGMDIGHLSYYYPAKEALWRDVLTEFARAFEDHVEAALATAAEQKTAAERAAIVLPSFLGFMAENPKLARLILQEFSIHSTRHDWVVDTMAKPLWLRLQPLFDELKSEGLLVDIDPTAAYFALVTGGVAFFASADEIFRISGYNVADAQRKGEVLTFLLRGLLGKTAAPSATAQGAEGKKKPRTRQQASA